MKVFNAKLLYSSIASCDHKNYCRRETLKILPYKLIKMYFNVISDFYHYFIFKTTDINANQSSNVIDYKIPKDTKKSLNDSFSTSENARVLLAQLVTTQRKRRSPAKWKLPVSSFNLPP